MLKLGTIDEIKSAVASGRGFAKSNLYYVKFPTVAGISAYDVGLLTNSITLPQRQLTGVGREIGMDTQQVVHGYVNSDIDMSFRVLNNQKVREYFENWQQFILGRYSDDEARYNVKYPDKYVAPLHIYQLERGKGFPLFNKQFDKKIGPININLDIDIDIATPTISNYHWVIDRAFPIGLNSGQLSDEEEGIQTINVTFSYKSWTGEKVTNGKQKASIFVNR